MLTSERAWADQQDLDALCNYKSDGTEPFAPSGFYGHAQVLREYIGASIPPLAIQHGVCLQDWVWGEEIANSYPIYCWQTDRVARYKANTQKTIIHGAAPFLYALALVKSTRERKGTLFFPAHSTQVVTAVQDWERLADEAAKLPPPVTVCLYWRGVQTHKAQHFTKRGLRVVSAGNMFDPQFSYRLAHLLLAHRYAASNDIGSHLFYATAAGCTPYYLPVEYSYQCSSDKLLQEAASSKPPERIAFFRALFGELHERPTGAQVGIVDQMLSAAQFRTPQGLREQLGVNA